MKWADFFPCSLWCNYILSDQHFSFICDFENASLLQLYLLNPWQWPKWSYEIGLFDHQVFLNFGMVLETLIKLCVTARFFGKTFFAKEIEEMVQKFHWMKTVHIICCVLAQVLCLGKNSFLRYRPKCCQSIRL